MPIIIITGNVSSGIVLENDTLEVQGVASATTVNLSGSMLVSSGGTAKDTTLNTRGRLYIFSGGTASVNTVESGGLVLVSGGTASATDVKSGGSMVVETGGSAFATTLANYAKMTVSSGAILNSVTVNTGAALFLSAGATVRNAVFNTGIAVNSSGAATGVISGVTLSGATLNNANLTVSGGKLNTVNLQAGTLTLAGVTANSNTVAGSLIVDRGAGANSNTIDYGGQIRVAAGAAASATTVNYGGSMLVSSGGTSLLIAENGGYVEFAEGADVTFAANTFSGVTVSGRKATVHSGTTANDLALKNEGTIDVYGSGIVNSVVCGGNDYTIFLHVHSGGTANSVTVNHHSRTSRWISGNVYYSGGFYVHSGGTATAATVNRSGFMYVENSAWASATTVNSSGCLYIYSGGTASANTVNGGYMGISSGGTALGIVENGGYVEFAEGANVTFVSNTFSGITLASASATVHSGTIANAVVLRDYTRLDIFSGGTANAIINNNSWGSASLNVYRGGVVNSATVNSVGYMYIMSGGTANSTTVNKGGRLYVAASGTANNVTVNSGAVTISSGGLVKGVIELNGADLQVEAGGIVDFSLAAETATTVLINDLNRVKGAPTYTVTLIEEQTAGTFKLANNADNVPTISIRNANGDMLGDVTTQAAVTMGGLSYQLKNDYGELNMIVSGSGITVDPGTSGVVANGVFRISSGQTSSGFTVDNAGQLYVLSGGAAVATTVGAKGFLYVSSGGVLRGLTVSSGGIVRAYGGTIDFDLSGRTAEDAAIVNDISLIRETPFFTVTVSGDQTAGTYKLADGAASFTGTVTVMSGGTSVGTVSVGQTLRPETDALSYRLEQTSGTLLLTITDDNQYISSGVTSTGLIVNSGEGWRVLFGGAVVSGTVLSGGEMRIASGGLLRGLAVSSGAVVSAYAGARVDFDLTDRNPGGTALINDLALVQGTPDYSVTISGTPYKGSYRLADGAAGFDGTITVMDGGTRLGTVTVGGEALAVGGAAYTLVLSGGALSLSVDGEDVPGVNDKAVHSGVTSTGVTVASGVTYRVFSGGVAAATTVLSGGEMRVSSGGVLRGLTASAGATVSAYDGATVDFDLTGRTPGGAAIVNDLARISGTPDFTITAGDPQASGTYALAGGANAFDGTITATCGGAAIGTFAVGDSVDIDGVTYSLTRGGGTLSFTVLDRNLYISGGVVSTGLVVDEGTIARVLPGGVASAVTVLSGGEMRISSGGVLRGLAVSSGAIVSAAAGAVVDFDLTGRTTDDGAIVNDLALVGGNPNFTVTVNERQLTGTYVLAEGAAAFSGTVSVICDLDVLGRVAVGGSRTVNGVTYSLFVEDGTLGFNVSGTPPVSGDIYISGGMSSPEMTVASNGRVFVLSGGFADRTALLPGAAMAVSAGGAVDHTVVSGQLTPAAGAQAFRGTLVVAGGAASRTTLQYGMMQLQNGTAADTEIASGGVLQISGGAADGNTVRAGGSMTVVSGTASGNTVASRGYAAVAQDGVLSGTELQTGGNLRISRGGTAEDVTVQSGGALLISRGGVLRGELDFADGAVVSALDGAEVHFDLAARTAADGALVHNLAAVQGTPAYSISVSASQTDGLYLLADGAADFDAAVTICNTDGICGSLAVGSSVRLADTGYLLSLEEQSLFLTVDATPPEAPTAAADITSATNGNVTVTAVFSDDSVLREYSRDSRIWNAYTEGIVFSENGVAYFRGTDAAGNVSDVTQYAVTNIDKVAPVKPTASANITRATNQDVTVTAAFSADSVVREYSLDGETWQNYVSGIVFAENGAVLFRGTDAAGNVSEVTRYAVSNIDKTAPAKPTAAADITVPTNQDVTVTAVFSDDTVKTEYSLDGRSWKAYTGGVVMAVNGTVSFRGTDAAGNVSEITRYSVTNIDKIPPETPQTSADVTEETTGRVTVTAAFSADSVVREYSLDGQSWRAYGDDGVVMSANGTVYFRGTDAAGNVSETASYEVSNIIGIQPGEWTADDLNADGRADIVMAIVQSGHDAYGAAGAWLIGENQVPVWGDLSTCGEGWEIFGMGHTAADKPTADVYLKNTDNVIGAWTIGADGNVSGWETVGVFDGATQIVGLGDFNGNGQTDLLLRNVNGAVGCYFTGGETTGWNYFQSLGDEWSLSAIGDLNGDGRDDVVLAHADGFAGSWLTQADGTMAWADLDNLPTKSEIVGTGDFNGDGTDDVLLKKGTYYGAWLVQDGNAKSWFGLGDLGDVTVEQIADFDGDGTDDLRVRTASGDLGALLVKGEDTLEWKYYGGVGAEWRTSLAAL